MKLFSLSINITQYILHVGYLNKQFNIIMVIELGCTIYFVGYMFYIEYYKII